MTGHHHHHDHDHSELSETELRVRALETVLTEKGYVDPAALDLLIETYEKKVGPRNGARVVAKAWADPAYRARLLKDATPAIAELGFAGRQGEHIVALEDFGVTLPRDTDIRVWDSTAEIRYLVLPMRPAGTHSWSEESLADLVTRDSMIGTGLPKAPT